VQMVRPAIDGVQPPAANPAVVGDRMFHQAALFRVKKSSRFGHPGLRFELTHRVGRLPAVSIFHPSPLVPRQPRSVRGPGQEVRQRLRQRRTHIAPPPHLAGAAARTWTISLAGASGWCATVLPYTISSTTNRL
jgi:hypothetical protein